MTFGSKEGSSRLPIYLSRFPRVTARARTYSLSVRRFEQQDTGYKNTHCESQLKAKANKKHSSRMAPKRNSVAQKLAEMPLPEGLDVRKSARASATVVAEVLASSPAGNESDTVNRVAEQFKKASTPVVKIFVSKMPPRTGKSVAKRVSHRAEHAVLVHEITARIPAAAADAVKTGENFSGDDFFYTDELRQGQRRPEQRQVE